VGGFGLKLSLHVVFCVGNSPTGGAVKGSAGMVNLTTAPWLQGRG
jgi:hypothetical protein